MLPDNQTPLEKALKKHLAQSQLPIFDDVLFQTIINRIELEKELQALKPKLWAAAGVLVGGLAMLIAAFNFSFHAFVKTQSFQYLSLMFTDFNSVISNWKDFSYSILETLPLDAMMILLGSVLASLFIFSFSFKQLINFKKIYLSR